LIECARRGAICNSIASQLLLPLFQYQIYLKSNGER
jgi:hypothetical protein